MQLRRTVGVEAELKQKPFAALPRLALGLERFLGAPSHPPYTASGRATSVSTAARAARAVSPTKVERPGSRDVPPSISRSCSPSKSRRLGVLARLGPRLMIGDKSQRRKGWNMVERSGRSVRSAIRVSRVPRRHRAAVLAVTSATVVVCVAPAAGYLQRTVNGPASVVPGDAYTFYVSGFSPGEDIYPTVQPLSCASRSERCVQAPCPSCASTRIGPSGTATVRFHWPKRSFYVFANMSFGHYKWRPGEPRARPHQPCRGSSAARLPADAVHHGQPASGERRMRCHPDPDRVISRSRAPWIEQRP